jgi:protein-S-isoprenylcysteine O-methyltransferase Ste14
MNSHDFLSMAKQLWVIWGPSPLGIATDLWMLLCLYWIVSALQQKRASKREAWLGRLQHTLMVGFAAFLIFSRYAHFSWLGKRFVPEWFWIAVAGVTLTAAGVALAMWARLHLGANWSGTVSIREQHELIRTGPYRWMRHPIYSGILLGMAGTVLVVGEVRGLIGFALMAVALYARAHKEEIWLNREFGASFEAHTQHTGMFLPRFS